LYRVIKSDAASLGLCADWPAREGADDREEEVGLLMERRLLVEEWRW
jgi:hypothetical protein